MLNKCEIMIWFWIYLEIIRALLRVSLLEIIESREFVESRNAISNQMDVKDIKE